MRRFGNFSMKPGRKIQRKMEARQRGWQQIYDHLIKESGWDDARIRAAFEVPGSRNPKK